MSLIISSHNKRPLRPRTTKYGCNCQMRENCPLQNQCLMLNLIYQADVENNAIKVPKNTLVLQKHPSKHGLEITTKTLTMTNKKSAEL